MPDPQISLLTAGKDRPYALGLAAALVAAGVSLDFIGSDEVNALELPPTPLIHFYNLRGGQSIRASLPQKMVRIFIYYGRLILYAATAQPKVFHILWNNKFEWFDRLVLMPYYRLLGKKIVFTAHNINIGERDGHDSFLNRLSLKIQYRLCHHIFVHNRKMQRELCRGFGIPEEKTSVIPLGINHTVPHTALTRTAAQARLGIVPGEKVILFFGQIAAYKGLEILLAAFEDLTRPDQGYRLIIVGRPKGGKDYCHSITQAIAHSSAHHRMILRIEFVPDVDTELYFKAADVLVLPYTSIFQSGVLCLAYSFGLPVIAADVGSLKEEIIEGKTGFVFPARDVPALANTLKTFFKSDLYHQPECYREAIRKFADEKYSWTGIAATTMAVYAKFAPAQPGRRPLAATVKS